LTPVPIGIDLKGLGLKGMFRPDGSPWFMIPEEIHDLPSFYRAAATEVWPVLLKYVREWGELDERLITRKIAEELESKHGHRCESFVAKGLYALQYLAKLIVRIRKHGRRIIVFLKGLLGQERSAPAPASPLSTPPPEKREIQETTTTREPSSSSLESIPKEADGPKPTAPPELVERACKLVPEATPDWVDAMVAVYGPEWFGRALDQVEERNRKPHALPVRKRKFVMDILAAWKDEGGPPKRLEDPRPAPLPSRPSMQGSAEKEPVHQVTAEELAELMGHARRHEWARRTISTAITNGGIGPELAATIPPELLERK
jgi:hypothetical protein